MTNVTGFCLSMIAAAVVLPSGGGGDQPAASGGGAGADTTKLERLAATNGGERAGLGGGDPALGFSFAGPGEGAFRVDNRVQLAWTHTSETGAGRPSNSSFSVRRARTALSGHLNDPRVTYKVQLDWAGGGSDNLRDAWLDWTFREARNGDVISLRVGQQKPRHGKEFTGSSAFLEHTKRSVASETFSGNRVLGAFLHGTHLDGDLLHWWAGVGNNDPAGASTVQEAGLTANPDNALSYYFDVHLDPFGDVGEDSYVQADLDHSSTWRGTVGASLLVGNFQPTGTAATLTGGADVETTSANAYSAWHLNGWSFLGEMFIRSDDSDFQQIESDSQGYAVGGGVVTAPREEGGPQWGLAARWSMVDQDDGPLAMAGGPIAALGNTLGVGNLGKVEELQATITRYHRANNLKTQLSYRFTEVTPEGASAAELHFIDVLFQWVF